MSEENTTGPALEALKIEKQFDGAKVLRGVSLAVRRDEVVAIIGPSGSGKSTFLRCLNLLERPDAGEIFLAGRPVPYRTLSASALSRHRTRVGMVFQHFNLFSHMRVVDNVAEAPVRVLRRGKDEARATAARLLERVGLADKLEAWPDQLSGGQQQRVAIARALAMEPEVLLLDEVTSALDVEMIAGINELLGELAKSGMTMVAVTHDLGFARGVADRICFFDEGEVVQEGPSAQLLDAPKAPRLKEFLATVLPARG